MKKISIIVWGLTVALFAHANTNSLPIADSANFFAADNANIQYTGRIDFTNPLQPKFWAPGVYIRAKFTGAYCAIIINDEVLYGSNHNYLEIVVDDYKSTRIQITGKSNTLKVADSLSDTEHTITICKNTESDIGYLQFIGFKCKSLLPLPAKPVRKIEFIGNSITCGSGSDLSFVPCDGGQWYDQQNAYLSYGPTTARSLNAQWQLSAVSGIGLIFSCCKMAVTMPQVFDKVNMCTDCTDSIKWDFNLYQPDVVTVTLGQNDGIRDSVTFCNAYVSFIKTLRSGYPYAHIICLTSPMGGAELTAALQNYLLGIVSFVNNTGDDKVHKFYYSKQYHNGCGGHPDLAEHQQIAAELTACIKAIMKW